jgi:hypothetical protein
MESLFGTYSEGRWILAVFCMDYHSGQWSRGYRLLCMLKPRNFSSALCKELRRSELYKHLEKNYSKKI